MNILEMPGPEGRVLSKINPLTKVGLWEQTNLFRKIVARARREEGYMHALVSTHCILDLYGCPPELLDDEHYAREGIVIASRKSLSTLCTISSHKFSPHGVTAMGLLAESHISIHTWPEHGYVGVDVYTCGRSAKPQRACEFLAEYFQAHKKSLLVVPRGRNIQSQYQPLAEKLNK